jgi:hypothetical protein
MLFDEQTNTTPTIKINILLPLRYLTNNILIPSKMPKNSSSTMPIEVLPSRLS